MQFFKPATGLMNWLFLLE